MTEIEQLKAFLEDIDFFGMVDRYWADHEKDGVVEAAPNLVIIQNGFENTWENMMIITDHFLSEMRREWPDSILVCHVDL